MFAALSKAIGQFPDPAFRRAALQTFLWSAALFVALVALAAWTLAQFQVFGIGWLDSALDWLGGLAAFVIGLIIFPSLAVIVIGFYLESIARAVEARHYPDLPPARQQPVWEVALSGVRLVGVTVLLNIVALPLYFVPVLNLFVFYVLNGYLLGREYFELVALRRLEPSGAKALRRQFKWRVFAGGVVITVLFSIPLINWIMPVVATAFMVHVLERLRRRRGTKGGTP